ncbi:hypothetical protein HHK36_002683 [Tetracentron sinense]|uniref:DM2 domain-containing protein n=1 Tax=Tetracentron sinense TaxID=13715 RepID=A0A835DNK1_TETSI|nr:hypothetical protein HHK36_002683 [Tetracentron sinense]
MALSLACCWPSFLAGDPIVGKYSSTLRFVSPSNLRMVRVVTSAASSKPATTGKREPRGITKPRPVSPAMQEFLGVSEIPRTQALKQIWAYIKQHNLQASNLQYKLCLD